MVILRRLLILFSLCILLASCGDSSGNNASVSFSLKLPDNSAKQVSLVTAVDICDEYGIDTIRASILNSAGTTVGSGTWACSSHTGYIGGLPEGSGYTISVDGLSGTNRAWHGTKSLTLVNNTTTDSGPVSVVYQANSVTQVVITVSATGSAAAGSLYAFGATVALPPGITLQADTSGMPLATALAKGSTLSANTLVTGKYSAPTTLSGSLLFAVADQSGFSIGPVATITGNIASGVTPPGASSYTVSSVAAHDSIGNPLSGIGGSVMVKYQ